MGVCESTVRLLHYDGRVYKLRVIANKVHTTHYNKILQEDTNTQKHVQLGIVEYLSRETIEQTTPAEQQFSTAVVSFDALREPSTSMARYTFEHSGIKLNALPYRYTFKIFLKNAPKRISTPAVRGSLGSLIRGERGVISKSPTEVSIVDVSSLLEIRSNIDYSTRETDHQEPPDLTGKSSDNSASPSPDTS